jgi:hypothetical protein
VRRFTVVLLPKNLKVQKNIPSSSSSLFYPQNRLLSHYLCVRITRINPSFPYVPLKFRVYCFTKGKHVASERSMAQQKPVSYSRSLSHCLHVRARNGGTGTSSHGDMYPAPGEGGWSEEFHPRGKKNKDRESAARIYAARSSGSGSTQ